VAQGDVQPEPIHGAVLRTERLTPRMVRVVLGGAGLDGFTPTPHSDQYVNLAFPAHGSGLEVPFDLERARRDGHPPLRRRCTVRRWEPAAGELTLDFVVHGDSGVAGRWANHARPGDRLQMTGPSGSYSPDPDASWHLMVGDESALPAIAASLEVVPPGRPAVVVAVVDDADHELALHSPAELELVWIHRGDRGDSSEQLVAALGAIDWRPGAVDVFAHGEAAETRAVRRHLLADRGLDRRAMSLSPYWRRGRDDEAWRAEKRDWLDAQERDVP
jgi:NADPH-dependent ferric siderophore reductase